MHLHGSGRSRGERPSNNQNILSRWKQDLRFCSSWRLFHSLPPALAAPRQHLGSLAAQCLSEKPLQIVREVKSAFCKSVSAHVSINATKPPIVVASKLVRSLLHQPKRSSSSPSSVSAKAPAIPPTTTANTGAPNHKAQGKNSQTPRTSAMVPGPLIAALVPLGTRPRSGCQAHGLRLPISVARVSAAAVASAARKKVGDPNAIPSAAGSPLAST